MPGWEGRLYLGPRAQRALLVAHLALVEGLIGGLSAILALATGSGLSDPQAGPGVALAIGAIHDGLVLPAAVGVVAIGWLFSLLTGWGFLEFWWVGAKWAAVALLLLPLITLWTAPATATLAALADLDGAASLASPAFLEARRRTILGVSVVLGTLAALLVLSVYKPWGRRRRFGRAGRGFALAVGGGLGLLIAAGTLAQTLTLRSYRRAGVEPLAPAAVADGRWLGEARAGIRYAVAVTVEGGRIRRIEVLSGGKSRYARLGARVAERIEREQALPVDAVTGATTTSRGIEQAVAAALRKARRR